MNRKLFVATTVALVLGCAAGALGATGLRKRIEVEYRNIQVDVDGKAVAMDTEPFLYVEQGRVFAPARPVAEALGAAVDWDATANRIHVYTPNYMVSEQQGQQVLWRFPFYGLSFRTPAGMDKMPGQEWLLQLSDPQGWYLGLAHQPAPNRQSLAEYADIVQNTIAVSMGKASVVETRKIKLAGREALATDLEIVSPDGSVVNAEVTVFRNYAHLWAFVSICPQSQWDQVRPFVEAVYQSVQLPSA